MFHLVTPVVVRWAERSQQRACRNAMVASTAMTRARVERDEVEEYVVGTLARRGGTDRVPAQHTVQHRAAASGA